MGRMMVKTCTKCGVEKEAALEYFSEITRNDKKYFIGICKDCRNTSKRKGTGKVLFTNEHFKQCGTCNYIKEVSSFASKGGKPSSKCKDCHNAWYREYYAENADLVRKSSSRYKKNNPDSLTNWGRRGFSNKEYSKMISRHDGKCWICKKEDGIFMDHDHDCCKRGCKGCVRGILCRSCNFVLGFAKDSREILIAAEGYLAEWEDKKENIG